MKISAFRILRGAVAALCGRRRDDRRFDSSAVMSAFRAKGALLKSAWGNAPGIMDQEDLSAESAYHERHESCLQRSPIISTEFPGAMPQARVEIAPLALKHGRFRDCRAVTVVKAGFVTLPCQRGELLLDRRVGFKPLPNAPWLPSPFRGSLQRRGVYDV